LKKKFAIIEIFNNRFHIISKEGNKKIETVEGVLEILSLDSIN